MRWPIPDFLSKSLPSKKIFVAGMQNEKTRFSKANISANKNFLGNLFATSFRNALDLKDVANRISRKFFLAEILSSKVDPTKFGTTPHDFECFSTVGF